MTPSAAGFQPATALTLGDRLVAYKDLAKLEIFDVYLTVPLAWSLMPDDVRSAGHTFVLLGLVLVGQLAILTAACALDDVMGVRDGIDTFTYGDDAALRKRKRKPLLDRRLTERQALLYSYSAIAVGLAGLGGAYVVAGFEPWWWPLLFLAVALSVLAYSWGPKLSYIGGQELVVILGFATRLCLTYAIVTEQVTTAVALQGLLLGTWLMQLTAFANVHDREGDARAGRNTMAVRLSPRTNDVYLAGLFAFGWAVLVAGLLSGACPWSLALLQLPCLALQALSLHAGLAQRDALRSRALGITILRLGWLGLFTANVIAGL